VEYEKVFEIISSPIEMFVKQYKLLIEKYRCDAPSWLLCFKRKKGGVGYIYINYLYQPHDEQNSCRDVQFEVVVVWTVDDYDTETRHSVRKRIGIFKYRRDLSKITDLLHQSMDVIKKLRHKDLEEHSIGMNWKSYYKTKEDFLQSISYPEIDI